MRAIAWLLLVTACGPNPPPGAPATPRLQASGVLPCPANGGGTTRRLDHPAAEVHRFTGGGIAAADLDGDGWLDLILPGPDRPRVRWGPDFTAVTDFGPADGAYAGALVAHLDDDGLPEVVLTAHEGPDAARATDGTPLPWADTLDPGQRHSQSATAADLDDDGWLDLVVAGHGIPDVVDDQVTITGPGDPTGHLLFDAAGPRAPTAPLPERFDDAYTFVVAPVELDGDGRADLYSANDYPNHIPQQAALATDDGWALADEGRGLSPHGAGMGLGIGDRNADGIDDLLLPVWNRMILLTSREGIGWVDSAARDGLVLPPHDEAWVGWGGELADLDNDGQLDVIAAFGHLDTLAARTVGGASAANAADQPLLWWRGTSDGFAPAEALLDDGAHRGFVLVDWNHDGALDLAAPRLDGGLDLVEGSCTEGHWLEVALVQEAPNPDAIGAQVWARHDGAVVARRTLRAGGTSLLAAGPPLAHLGLGSLEAVDLEVHWPDGEVESFPEVATRQRIVITR